MFGASAGAKAANKAFQALVGGDFFEQKGMLVGGSSLDSSLDNIWLVVTGT